jgi:hypothetical protein
MKANWINWSNRNHHFCQIGPPQAVLTEEGGFKYQFSAIFLPGKVGEMGLREPLRRQTGSAALRDSHRP